MPPIYVKETNRRSSQLGESPSRERSYTLWGSIDPDVIEAAFIDGTDAYVDGSGTISFPGIPATNGGLFLQTTSVESRKNSAETWDCIAEWTEIKAPQPQKLGEIRTYSRTGIRMVKVKTSRQTISSVADPSFNGGTPEDFKGLVNVQEDGSVEGADSPEPFVIYGVKIVMPTSTVTDAYELAAHSIVGKLNSVAYRGRPVRTLRSESVNINYINEDQTEIAAEFSYAEHLTDIVVSGISGIDKEAWDYMWPYKIKRKGSQSLRPQTVQVNVERFHKTANFGNKLLF